MACSYAIKGRIRKAQNALPPKDVHWNTAGSVCLIESGALEKMGKPLHKVNPGDRTDGAAEEWFIIFKTRNGTYLET